jgi:hypothetical protein
MTVPIDPPPGFVALDLGKGCVLVIREQVYLAGLKLGKALRRRAAAQQWPPKTPPTPPT